MSSKDLPGLGETPATPEEETRAEQIEVALHQLTTEAELPPGPDQLVGTLVWAFAACRLFRREAGLLDEFATLPTPTAGATLPDPFPGEYLVVRPLGQGTFGTVWLADDLNLKIQVALKALRLDKVDRQSALAALRNEAAILAGCPHRNLVQVHAWRTSGPDVYLVLQYVEGESLEDRLRREGPLPWELAARYVADVAEGLLAVHERGIIHRDVKPANVLWDRQRDEALLTDFGVAAALFAHSVAGSPPFMAPEAFDGVISPALDTYSLTATLFRLATKHYPFVGETTVEIQQAARRGLAKDDARFAGMPARLDEVIRAGLAPRPAQRPSLKELSERLRGGLNQALADTLPMGASGGMRLTVSKALGGGQFQRLVASQAPPEHQTRNLKKVPMPPEQVQLRTGDWVRVEVVPERDGHLTVLNVGPKGDLNLLEPDDLQQGGRVVRANETVVVDGIQLQPPSGRERLFAVWTARPTRLSLEGWQGLAERGELPPSEAYQATRNMVRIKQAVQALGKDEWRVAVLELEHEA